MMVALIICLFALTVIHVCGQREVLVYTSIGHGTFNFMVPEIARNSGIFGGTLELDKMMDPESVNDTDLFERGLYCRQKPYTWQVSLLIDSVGFDPFSQTAIMLTQSREGTGFPIWTKASLFSANMCSSPVVCNNASDKADLINYLWDAENTDKPPAVFGMVGIYDQQIYFLLTRFTKNEDGTLNSVLQLRRLQGCEDSYPITGDKKFDIDKCSSLLVNVTKLENFRPTVAHVKRRVPFHRYCPIWPASQMIIKDNQGSLQFIFLLHNMSYTWEGSQQRLVEYSLDMTLIDMADSSISHLHSEPLDLIWDDGFLSSLGGLSLKGATLCWTTIYKVLCGSFSSVERNLVKIQHVLNPGEASQACRFIRYNDDGDFGNVVTGVTIVTASDDQLSLLFGCNVVAANSASGWLKLTRNKQKQIITVRDQYGSVPAALLDITQNCLTKYTSSGTNRSQVTTHLTLLAINLIILYLCDNIQNLS